MEKQNAQSNLPRTKIWPGQEWLHYKGGLYTIVELGVKEDTGELMVVYKSQKYGTVWIRNVDNWFETVVTSEGEVPRFLMRRVGRSKQRERDSRMIDYLILFIFIVYGAKALFSYIIQ